MLANVIVLVVVLGLAALAVYRARKKGDCCGGCAACHGGTCHCHDRK